MKLSALTSLSRRALAPAPKAQRVPPRCPRLSRFLAPLCAGLFLCATALHAGADGPTQIFLYNANGDAVNVTATYSYKDNLVYDMNNDLVGTVDAQDDIVNTADQVIGYIQPD